MFYAEVLAWVGAVVILVTSYYIVRKKIAKKNLIPIDTVGIK